MKIGDLVREINPWTKHNPWMRFSNESLAVGLVIELTKNGNAMVLWAGENNTVFCQHNILEVIK